MYCTNCGRQIEDGERYCPYCGTKTFNEYEFNQQRVDYAISRRSIPMCIILSIVTFGIYGLYWLYKVGERLSNFQAYQGEMVDSYRALVYLILGIFGINIVARALIQNDLNKYAYDS